MIWYSEIDTYSRFRAAIIRDAEMVFLTQHRQGACVASALDEAASIFVDGPAGSWRAQIWREGRTIHIRPTKGSVERQKHNHGGRGVRRRRH